MANETKTTKGHMTQKYLQRSAGLIVGAVGDYFKNAAPVTSNIVEGASSSIRTIESNFRQITSKVLPKSRQLKTQASLRNISRWFLTKEDEFDAELSDSLDQELSFDTESGDISEVEMNETEIAANNISSNVIAAAGKTVEANMELTANILTAIDNQTGILTNGINTINDNISKLIEIVTKNTSAMVEAQVASTDKEDLSDKMISEGKFNFGNYKKVVAENFKNSEFGLLGMLGTFLDPNMAKMMLTPENITSMLMDYGINKVFPNLKGNIKALDDEINETLMSALISLGDRSGEGGLMSFLGKFGLKTARKEFDTEKGTFEVKPTPFDTVTRESIIHTIPGYLERILERMGGEDLKYDYRSRQFRTAKEFQDEFNEYTTINRGMHWRTSQTIKDAFGFNQADENTTKYANMIYNMMLTDLGQKQNHTGFGEKTNDAVKQIHEFKDADNVKQYISSLFKDQNVDLTEAESKYVDFIANNISALWDKGIGNDIRQQVAKENIYRNKTADKYLKNLSKYETGIEGLKTDYKDEIRNILVQNGIVSEEVQERVLGNKENITEQGSYVENALYKIYRKLDEGLNVYVVGQDESRAKAFSVRKNRWLKPPAGLRQKIDSEESDAAASKNPALSEIVASRNELEIPTVQEVNPETGEIEERPGGFKEKVATHGKALRTAIFTGDGEAVRNAFGNIAIDIGEVAKDKLSDMMGKVNDKFGNVSGWLKHKFTGKGYSYTDENGNTVEVADNEKGGVFGFVKNEIKESFTSIKKKASGWFKGVSKMFDYGDKDEDQTVKSKRSKLISGAIGAFAGAGILGGPIGALIGGVAGSALSGLNVGQKIKDLFFGRDKETGKAKGIFTKFADSVVKPIQYQIGKTAHAFAGLIRKNIIGPISDIGVAIKERIKASADKHFGKAFKFIGNVLMAPFRLAKNLIKLPFQAVNALLGGLTRTGAKVTTGAFGGAVDFLAGAIGGEEARKKIKERRRERAQDYKNWSKYETDENGDVVIDENGNPVKNKYSSYRAWIKQDRQKWLDRQEKLKEATAEVENVFTPAEIEERQRQRDEEARKLQEEQLKKQEEGNVVNQQIADNVSDMAHESLTEGSLYTHDAGIHERLDTLISSVAGISKELGAEPVSVIEAKSATPISEVGNQTIETVSPAGEAKDEAVSFTTLGAKGNLAGFGINVSEIASAKEEKYSEKRDRERRENDEKTVDSQVESMAAIATEGGVDEDEGRLLTEAVKEQDKENSSSGRITSLFSQLIRHKSEKDENKEEKKESLWDRISGLFGSGGILDTLKNIVKYGAIVAAGVAALKLFWDNLDLKTALDNIGKWFKKFFKDDDDEDTTTGEEGINQAGAIVDVSGGDNPILNAMNPFADLYHTEKDGQGNYITNVSATRAKQDAYLGGLKSSLPGLGRDYGAYLDARNAYNFAKQDLETSIAGMTTEADLQAALAKEEALTGLKQNVDDAAAKWDTSKSSLKTKAGNVLDKSLYVGSGLALSVGAGQLADLGLTYGSEKVLSAVGLSDEAAEKYSNIIGDSGNRIVTAVSTRSIIKQAASTNKTGIAKAAEGLSKGLKSVLEGIEKFFSLILDKVKSSKTFGWISEKLGPILSKLKTTVTKFVKDQGEKSPIVQKFATKSTWAAAKGNSGFLAAIPILAGTLAGEIEGLAQPEYLFRVAPGQYDYDMQEISVLWKGILGAAEFTPFAWIAVLVLDVLDTIIGGLGILEDGEVKGLTLSQFICRAIYKLFCPGKVDKLTNLQLDLANMAEIYNAAQGTNLNAYQYNDLINGQSAISEFIFGSDLVERTDAQGNKYYDNITEEEEKTDYRGVTGHLKAARDVLGAAGEWVGDRVGDVKDWIVDTYTNWKDNVLTPGWENFKETIQPAVDVAKEVIDNVKETAEGAWDWTKERIGDAKDAVVDTWNNFKDNVITPGWDSFKENVSTAWQWTKDTVGAAKDKLSDWIDSAKDVASETWENVKSGFNKAKDTVGEYISGIRERLEPGLDKIKEVASNAWDYTKDMVNYGKEKLSGWIDSAKNIASDTWKNVKTGLGNAWEFTKNTVSSAKTTVTEWVSNAWKTTEGVFDNIKKGASDFFSGIGTAVSSAWDTVSSLAKSVKDSVVEFFTGTEDDEYSGVKGHLKAAKDMVGAGVDWLGEKASDFFEWIGFGGPKEEPIVQSPITPSTSITNNTYNNYYGKEEAIGGTQQEPIIPHTSITNNTYNQYGVGGPSPLDKESVITSDFGKRTFPRTETHKGIDLAPADKTGKATVGSTVQGVVSYVKKNVPDTDTAKREGDGRYHYRGSNSGGNQVWIDTADGHRIKNMHMKYGSIPDNISVGGKVEVGTKIGDVGSTGWSTGPHLHYQVEDKKGKPINPSLAHRYSSISKAVGGPTYDTSTLGDNSTGSFVNTGLGSRMFIPSLTTSSTNDKSNEVTNKTVDTTTDKSTTTTSSGDKTVLGYSGKDIENYRYDSNYAYLMADSDDELQIARKERNSSGYEQKSYQAQLVNLIKKNDYLTNPEAAPENTTSKLLPKNWWQIYAWARSIATGHKTFDDMQNYYVPKPTFSNTSDIEQYYSKVNRFNNETKADVQRLLSIGSDDKHVLAETLFPLSVYGKYYDSFSDRQQRYQTESPYAKYRAKLGLPTSYEVDTSKESIYDPNAKVTYVTTEPSKNKTTIPDSKFILQDLKYGDTFFAQQIKNPDEDVVERLTGDGRYAYAPISTDENGITATDADVVESNYATEDSYYNTYNAPDVESTEEDRGVLGNIFYQLKKVGGLFLNTISGGLFGESLSKDDELKNILNSNLNGNTESDGMTDIDNSTTATTGSVLTTDIEKFKSVFLEPYKYTYDGPGTAIKRFLKMVQDQVGTPGNDGGTYNNKYNHWYWGDRGSYNGLPWCMAFVQWCFANAGFKLKPRTAACQDMYVSAKSNGTFIPYDGAVKPGDIGLMDRLYKWQEGGETHSVSGRDGKSDHTFILLNKEGDTFNCVDGNWGKKVSRVSRKCNIDKGSKGEKGPDILGFVRAVNFDVVDKLIEKCANLYKEGKSSEIEGFNAETGDIYTTSQSDGSVDYSRASLFNYFNGVKGYPAGVTAGILGSLEGESKTDGFRAVEGHHDGLNKNGINMDTVYKEMYGDTSDASLDKVASDRALMNEYRNKLFDAHGWEKVSLGYEKGKAHSYYGSDGKNFYVGMGIAQWTGSRGRALLDYAANNGKKWYDAKTQLDFIDYEIQKKGYANTTYNLNDLKSKTTMTPSEAADIWTIYYEGCKDGSSTKRKKLGEEIYNEYKAGKYKVTSPNNNKTTTSGSTTSPWDFNPWNDAWSATDEQYKKDWNAAHPNGLPSSLEEWKNIGTANQNAWNDWILTQYPDKINNSKYGGSNVTKLAKEIYGDSAPIYGMGGSSEVEPNIPFMGDQFTVGGYDPIKELQSSASTKNMGVGSFVYYDTKKGRVEVPDSNDITSTPEPFAESYADHSWGDMANQFKLEDGEIRSDLVQIGHAEHDENSEARGGARGDQTDEEVHTANWYNVLEKPWTTVLRANSQNASETIAKAMEAACKNNNIGYNQDDRTSLFDLAKNNGFQLDKVGECNTDCSALVATCVNAAGIPVSKDIYTGNQEDSLMATGEFTSFQGSEFATKPWNLKRGDILLKKGHTAVVLNEMKYSNQEEFTKLKKQYEDTLAVGGPTIEPSVARADISEIIPTTPDIDINDVIPAGGADIVSTYESPETSDVSTSATETGNSTFGQESIDVGGPTIEPDVSMKSEIVNDSHYTKPLLSTYENIGRSISSRITSSNASTIASVGGTTTEPIENIYNITTKETDLSGVLSAFNTAIQKLQAIVDNTTNSNAYLDELNKKDFVDQGLRNALDSLSKVKPKKQSSARATSSTASTVASIARG